MLHMAKSGDIIFFIFLFLFFSGDIGDNYSYCVNRRYYAMVDSISHAITFGMHHVVCISIPYDHNPGGALNDRFAAQTLSIKKGQLFV